MTDTGRIAQMAEGFAPELEPVVRAVAMAVAEDCAGVVDSADTPDGWSNSHISDAIRSRYSKETT